MDRRRVLLVVAVVIAAMGAALVFVYAQNADDRAQEQVAEQLSTQQILVATQVIQPGEAAADAAAAGKMLLQEVPQEQVVAGATGDGRDFTDQVALTTIYPGEQVITQKFGSIADVEASASLPLPEGKVGVAVVLDDQARVSGFTKPGTRVGMLITGTFPPATTPETRLMLDNVQILATGLVTINQQPTVEGEPAAPATDSAPLSQYVLALTPRDAARLEFAQTLGELSLVLLPSDETLKIGDPITSDTLFDE
ncbi:MAG: Flp pilus assembly protein CpaB [Nocardioides sp.]|nr:Flp pilus assembly protein CpaB [Nocardioides sp.]